MSNPFRVVALLSVYNESDILPWVLEHLHANGVDFYVIDDGSTDDSVSLARAFEGRGLIGIETFSRTDPGCFEWSAILRRKERLAREIDADWFIHHDADEIRESPWPGRSLRDAIQWVDRVGYNCIDFRVLNFPPIDDGYQVAHDPRTYFVHCEDAGQYDRLQLKCWKASPVGASLSGGGHEASFPDRRVFPIRFLLRHYPIRGQTHGRRKVCEERIPRFSPAERQRGWHVQYDTYDAADPQFLRDPETLRLFDLERTRLELCLDNEKARQLESRLAEVQVEHERVLAEVRADRDDAQAERDRALAQGQAELEDVGRRGQERCDDMQAQRDRALAEVGRQRAEMQAQRDRALAEVGRQRAEMQAEIDGALAEIQRLRAETQAELDSMRAELAAQRDQAQSAARSAATKSVNLLAVNAAAKAMRREAFALKSRIAALESLAEQALTLRGTTQALWTMLDDPSLKQILGPWASRRWRLLGAKLPRALRAPHDVVARLASRSYANRGWGRALARPELASPPAQPSANSAEMAAREVPIATSIIIPVRGRADLTEACIAAIRVTVELETVQIIVVDNGSSDGTTALLGDLQKEIERLVVLRREENLGFGPACNLGASVAGGENLLFLNNDTIPLAGWLDAMLARLRADARIGAVGARLVFPDGRLQEAGAIVWSDGAAANFGRGDLASHPAYARTREVDFCSAACLMVRAELFHRLGGFDAAFAPAYYEDVDLCFRVREAGYTVVYEPDAVVIHIEGGTAGDDVANGFKDEQLRKNRELLLDRWRSVLDRQWPHRFEFAPFAAVRRPTLLVVTPHLPMADFAGGDLRLQTILDLLSTRFQVVIFAHDHHPGYDARKAEDPYVRRQTRQGIEVVMRDERSLAEELERRSYDFVWLEFYGMAERYLDVVRQTSPHSTIVIDSVDLHFVRRRRGADLVGDLESLGAIEHDKRTELSAYLRADLVLVVSEADSRRLRAELPTTQIGIVPTIHGAPSHHNGNHNGAGIERDRIFFIGGFRHPPNVDAVLYFAAEIWPRIRERRPDLTFCVAGTMAPPELLALHGGDGIEVVGWVPETEEYYRRSLVAVAPIRYGAGMNCKIGEAFAMQVPVVTTPLGAEGMDLVDGVHARIAPDAASFAAAVLELCENRETGARLAENARLLAEARWSPEVVNHRLLVELGRAWSRRNVGRDEIWPVRAPNAAEVPRPRERRESLSERKSEHEDAAGDLATHFALAFGSNGHEGRG